MITVEFFRDIIEVVIGGEEQSYPGSLHYHFGFIAMKELKSAKAWDIENWDLL
jgi:hypothetical protein